MLRTRALLAALGVTALLAGCGASATAGGPSPADDRPSLELTATEEKEAGTGFDECGLIDLEKAAEFIGVDDLYVTSRAALTQNDGSRRASCAYYPEDLPGTTGVVLATVTDTDPDRFFAPFEKQFEDVLPIEGIGDRAERSATTRRAPRPVLRDPDHRR